MQIDAIDFKHLTKQEQTQRCQENQCLYRGEAKHTTQYYSKQ